MKPRRSATLAVTATFLISSAAACGGSGDRAGTGRDLRTVCKRQQVLLANVPDPAGLRGAASALRRVIAMDRDLLPAVQAGGSRDALVGRLRRADTNARRSLASIEHTDPDRSMSPLRTGAASGRRVLLAARALLAEACRGSPG